MKLMEIKNYLNQAADIFVPRVCCICSDELRSFEKNFCTECFASLPFTHFWEWEDNPGKEMFRGRLNVKGVTSLLLYKGEVREAMHDFKYHRKVGIGEELGEMLGEVIASAPYMQDALKEGITIVPIPLHKRKRRKRGYNQAEVIARSIKRGISEDDNNIFGEIVIKPYLLKRQKFTNTQTALDKAHRYNNIQNAFRVNERRMKRLCSKKKRRN